MFNEKVGAYIMILRKARKFTQQCLADKLGVSHQAVSNWERGESMPDISILPKLASLLGTTTDNLLSADRDDFTGFDDILKNVNIISANVPRTKNSFRKTKDSEILQYLDNVTEKLNEIIIGGDTANNK